MNAENLRALAAADEPLWPNAWICGHCDQVTDVTHFYADRATGTMHHCADDKRRAEAADQCGARFDDTYESPSRCKLRHGHGGNHRSHSCHWSDTSRGHIKPYEIENGSNA